MSPRKNTQSTEYKSMGTFHWKHFTEKGNWHPGVNSTAPRLEFMQSKGGVKEFSDEKKQVKFNVIFDAEYVFEYLYQKIIVNMGWENDGKIDNEILGFFLKDFADYCSTVEQRKQLAKLQQQARELSETFPNKTAKEWEAVLLSQLQSTIGTPAQVVDDYRDQVVNKESSSTDDDEEMISMDDYDPDVEEDCGEDWNPPSYTDIDLGIEEDEEANILATENEALGTETKGDEAVTVFTAVEEDTNGLGRSCSTESSGDLEIEEIKNTIEEVSPIVATIESKKRGRPKKSLPQRE